MGSHWLKNSPEILPLTKRYSFELIVLQSDQ